MSASARAFRAALAAATLPLVLAVWPAGAAGATGAAGADQVLDLAALRGRVVYLDFWASWCAPCRESFPWMSRLQQGLGTDGLVVIAVNVDRLHADAERFLHDHPAGFRVVFDPDGLLAEKFGVEVMPSSFLIDRAGRVRFHHRGFRLKDRDALAQQVRSLVRVH